MNGLPLPFVASLRPPDPEVSFPFITEREGDAFALGALDELVDLCIQAEGDAFTLTVTRTAGAWKVGDTDDNYWGSGHTLDDALRWCIGAVLDPREES